MCVFCFKFMWTIVNACVSTGWKLPYFTVYEWVQKRFFFLSFGFSVSVYVTMIIVYLLWEHHSMTIAKAITINFQLTNAFIIQIVCIRDTCNDYALFIIWIFFVNAILKKIIITHCAATHIVVVGGGVVVHVLMNEITEMILINSVNRWNWLHFCKSLISTATRLSNKNLCQYWYSHNKLSCNFQLDVFLRKLQPLRCFGRKIINSKCLFRQCFIYNGKKCLENGWLIRNIYQFIPNYTVNDQFKIA